VPPVPDLVLPPGVGQPDFMVAAIGRSGSTMLCNWLCRPPDHLVFVEPFFLKAMNPRLLRIQLADFGMAASDEEWEQRDESGPERFRRIMGPRLAGKQWAFKEVLHDEHVQALQAFAPKRVIVTVRDIEDIALSFFEKHRLQANMDRFDDTWVIDYCLRESAGILRLVERMDREGIPHKVVRYEDFTRSSAERSAILNFIGWQGGGRTDIHLASFDRAFEADRHGGSISSRLRGRNERNLGPAELALAAALPHQAAEYQRHFAYR
jgi:hypothetical protein